MKLKIIAVGSWLAWSLPAAAGEMMFAADQYGELNLRLPQSVVHLENILGDMDNFELMDDYNPDSRLRQLGRPIGRLDVLYGDVGVGSCTAALVTDQYLLTNNHCVAPNNELGQVTEASVVFGYLSAEDTSDARRYIVDPEPIEANQSLDYAVLRVRGDPASLWGRVVLNPRDPQAGDALLLIQHPAGQPMRVTRRACRAGSPNAIAGDTILHTCDSLPGSSGSPLFSDDDGTVIGLHYAGQALPGSGAVNAAIRLTRIVAVSQILSSLLRSPGPDGTVGSTPRPQGPDDEADAPSAAQFLLQYACASRDAGQRVVDACTEIIEGGSVDTPDLMAAYISRGVAYINLGITDRAIGDFTAVIQIDPTNAQAFALRGTVYSGSRFARQQAIDDFDQAIRIDPEFSAAYYGRGTVYAVLSEEYLRRLDVHGFLQQYRMAIEDYDQAVHLDPSNGMAYTDRGIANNVLQQYQKAIADFDMAIRLDPSNYRAYDGRGSAYSSQGQYQQAIIDFDKAIRIEPTYAAAYFGRATARCHLQLPGAEADWLQNMALRGESTYLQEILSMVGYYNGSIDGVFGPASRVALRAWVGAGCPYRE